MTATASAPPATSSKKSQAQPRQSQPEPATAWLPGCHHHGHHARLCRKWATRQPQQHPPDNHNNTHNHHLPSSYPAEQPLHQQPEAASCAHSHLRCPSSNLRCRRATTAAGGIPSSCCWALQGPHRTPAPADPSASVRRQARTWNRRWRTRRPHIFAATNIPGRLGHRWLHNQSRYPRDGHRPGRAGRAAATSSMPAVRLAPTKTRAPASTAGASRLLHLLRRADDPWSRRQRPPPPPSPRRMISAVWRQLPARHHHCPHRRSRCRRLCRRRRRRRRRRRCARGLRAGARSGARPSAPSSTPGPTPDGGSRCSGGALPTSPPATPTCTPWRATRRGALPSSDRALW
jgi:hypothetical protein